MVTKTPKDRVVPLPNGHEHGLEMGVINYLLSEMILEVVGLFLVRLHLLTKF